MNEIIMYIVCGILSAIGGAILYFIQKHFKQHEKRSEDAEDRRTQKDLLVLKSLKAIGELCVANAIAVKTGHTNGEMEKARADFESVDKELDAFLLEQAVKKTRGGGK